MGSRGQKHKVDLLPKTQRDRLVREVILGRMSMLEASRQAKVSDTSFSRFMRTVTEDERLEIIADAISHSKMAEAQQRADLVNEFGEDTDKDLKWVLRELRSLMEDAKGDEDRMMQLGSLKEIRQSLMALADLHGKLNKRMDVHLNLNESPQFIQLRKIILTVLDRHPEAKLDFLDEMNSLQVIEAKPLPV